MGSRSGLGQWCSRPSLLLSALSLFFSRHILRGRQPGHFSPACLSRNHGRGSAPERSLPVSIPVWGLADSHPSPSQSDPRSPGACSARCPRPLWGLGRPVPRPPQSTPPRLRILDPTLPDTRRWDPVALAWPPEGAHAGSRSGWGASLRCCTECRHGGASYEAVFTPQPSASATRRAAFPETALHPCLRPSGPRTRPSGVHCTPSQAAEPTLRPRLWLLCSDRPDGTADTHLPLPEPAHSEGAERKTTTNFKEQVPGRSAQSPGLIPAAREDLRSLRQVREEGGGAGRAQSWPGRVLAPRPPSPAACSTGFFPAGAAGARTEN